MSDLQCPSCGGGDRLTGRQVDGEIEISCAACGHRWLRGPRRCRGCGGVEQVVGRQRMTTYPRGNQLAVIGMRDVPLCPLCDGDALAALGDDRLLDSGYRSRFVSGPDEGAASASARSDEGAASSGARSAPQPASAPQSRALPPAGSARSRPTGGPAKSSGRPSRPAGASRPTVASPRGAAAPVPSPTVRQAVQAYLEHAPDAVSAAAMLVVGRTLGPTTRLADVSSEAAQTLADAVDQHWAGQASLRGLAVDAINDAFRFWSGRGWVAADSMPQLPRES